MEQIIKLVSENGFGQIFITDTNRKYLDEILLAMNHDYALFLNPEYTELAYKRIGGEI